MDLLQILTTIISTLLLITILVFVHELGHFLAAKLFKADVREFAIGFGKRIIYRKWRGTIYSIRSIPLGGFVELEGETDSTSPNSFRNKRVYQKVIILTAGVIMNLLFAAVMMTIFLANNGYRFTIPSLTEYNFHNIEGQVEAYPLFITGVDENGNSAGQLEQGEIIIGINNIRFETYKDFQEVINQNQGQEVIFEFFNLETFQTNTRNIVLGYANEEGAILNVTLFELARSGSIAYPAYYITYPENLLAGTNLTIDLTLYIPKSLGAIIGNAFATGNFTELGNSVGSPLQIIDNSNQIVESGAFSTFIPLAGLLSISLAIFNILPFPALDGGQIVIVLIEKLLRRKIPDSILEKINLIGFILITTLAVVLIFKDFIQLNVLNKISEFIQNISQR